MSHKHTPKRQSKGVLKKLRDEARRLHRPKAKDQAFEFFNDTGELYVTDHAMLRYLQRVYGFNFREVKEEILSFLNPFFGDGKYLGNGKYPIPNTEMVFIVKDKAVISVVPNKK